LSKRFIAGVLGAMAAISLVGASAASGATQFGDPCVADEGAPAGAVTIFQLAAPASPFPTSAPISGVVTKWTLNLISPEGEPIPPVITQTLKVLRINAAAKTATAIGEDTRLVGSGANAFDTRIPVQAGDRLGLFGPGSSAAEIGTLYCETSSPADIFGAIEGAAPQGSASPYEESAGEARVPVVAVLEPDLDNDGFGDETQDKCPQSAALQTACPSIVLSASSIVKKGLVTVLVTSTSQAPVTVVGTAKLGKGKSATLKGGTQVVAPGAIARFTLLFPKTLKSKLKELSTKQRLTLNLTATATNVAGQPSSKALKVKLKGQAKPKHKGAKRKGHA
jgi:hypothetical protein